MIFKEKRHHVTAIVISDIVSKLVCITIAKSEVTKFLIDIRLEKNYIFKKMISCILRIRQLIKFFFNNNRDSDWFRLSIKIQLRKKIEGTISMSTVVSQ